MRPSPQRTKREQIRIWRGAGRPPGHRSKHQPLSAEPQETQGPGHSACVILMTSALRVSVMTVAPLHQRCRTLFDFTARSARTIRCRQWGRPVTRIVVPPLETPAPCRVRLAATTSKPCENVAEYRIRSVLPYILRSTPLLGATGEKHAACQSGSYQKWPMSRGTVI